MRQRTLLPIAIIFLGFLQLTVSGSNVINVDGDRFQMNGKPYDMWGIRVASASQSQELTDELIANLDDYKSYGVNTVAVFIQGSSGGFSDPFSTDGKSIDAGHLTRIRQIIEACDDRRMVAIIGIFYQRTMANYNKARRLASANAVVEAVRTTTRALKLHGNIILNIANEQNSAKYDQMRGGASRIYDFRDLQKIIDLCRVVRSEDANRLIGGGGYHDENNIVIGRSADVDILLFDSLGPDKDHQSGWHYDLYLANGVRGKPMVNVEMFGGWTARFVDSNGEGGYYPQSGKLAHCKEVDDAAIRPGLSVFFHSNAWCQGPSAGQPVRYDLAGDGTSTSPGIRWYFEHVRRSIENDKPEIIGVGSSQSPRFVRRSFPVSLSQMTVRTFIRWSPWQSVQTILAGSLWPRSRFFHRATTFSGGTSSSSWQPSHVASGFFAFCSIQRAMIFLAEMSWAS